MADKKPILIDFPYSFETERLTIRGPLPGDGKELHTAVSESQAEIKPWLPWAVNVMSAEDYEARVRDGQLKFLAREDLWLMLMLKGTHTIIGNSGLHRIDWSVPKFEIGYWLRSGFVGQGFMTEAVKAITNFAFDQLGAKRVEIQCDSLNVRSAAVARRLNYTHEGTIRHDDRDHLTGDLRDTMLFSRIERIN
ncbi:MAG: GNAT family N-acetyltransferase [Anaerolineales bacterium]|nr:GNAT family N-acetyltransferase [Anaerolineales bacterium]